VAGDGTLINIQKSRKKK